MFQILLPVFVRLIGTAAQCMPTWVPTAIQKDSLTWVFWIGAPLHSHSSPKLTPSPTSPAHFVPHFHSDKYPVPHLQTLPSMTRHITQAVSGSNLLVLGRYRIHLHTCPLCAKLSRNIKIYRLPWCPSWDRELLLPPLSALSGSRLTTCATCLYSRWPSTWSA